jgi:hypothetical protein
MWGGADRVAADVPAAKGSESANKSKSARLFISARLKILDT